METISQTLSPAIQTISRQEAIRLFEANKNLIPFALNLHFHRAPVAEQEEIHSIALRTLWRVCELYNPSRGEISTVAVRAIRNRVGQHLKNAADRYSRLSVVSLDDLAGENRTLSQHDLVASPDVSNDPVCALLQKEDMQRAIRIVRTFKGRPLERILQKARRFGLLPPEENPIPTQVALETARAKKAAQFALALSLHRQRCFAFATWPEPARITDRKIAACVGITVATLGRWEQRPEWIAECKKIEEESARPGKFPAPIERNDTRPECPVRIDRR